MTFYQTNIPVEVMGRVASFYALCEAVLTMMMTGICGALAHVLSIRTSVMIGTPMYASYLSVAMFCHFSSIDCQKNSASYLEN